MKRIFIILILGCFAGIVHGQVPGCTDPLSNNFNPLATVNDGSCTYNATSYTPPVKVDPINSTLVETSGLQWAGNSLWTFNDSGGEPAIYRIDTMSN
ncbi:MAG: T9SS C-terminal target domain-containing protein, partial [Pedobacter sp.]